MSEPSAESMEKAREADLKAAREWLFDNSDQGTLTTKAPITRLAEFRAQAREAAERERRQGPWGSEPQPKISDRCPSCGSVSIFIGSGGWLTCAILGCKSPGVGTTIEALRKERDEARATIEDLTSTLPHCSTCGVVLNCTGTPDKEHRTKLAEAEARVCEVEQERDKIKHGASRLRCPEHAMDASWAWGCPGCVEHLRGEVRDLRAALAEYRLRCSGWTIYTAQGAGHPGVSRAPDDSWEVQNRRVDALLARTETPKP